MWPGNCISNTSLGEAAAADAETTLGEPLIFIRSAPAWWHIIITWQASKTQAEPQTDYISISSVIVKAPSMSCTAKVEKHDSKIHQRTFSENSHSSEHLLQRIRS